MRKKSIFSLIVLMALNLVYASEDESTNDVFISQVNEVEDWEELGVLGLGILTANIAYSADGKHLAVGTSRGVEIWDTEVWAIEQWLLGHRGAVRSVSWSPDSTKIVSGSDRPDYTVKVWDIETGRELMTLTGHTHRVDSVAWSPDGKKIASAEGNFGGRKLKVWNAENGRLLLDIEVGDVLAIAWSPDGRRLVSSAGTSSKGSRITVWDAETGRPLVEGSSLSPFTLSLSWSPTRNEIAASGEPVGIFDSETGRLLRSLEHEGGAVSVAWSPDGGLLASGSGHPTYRTIKIWDVESGEALLTLSGHKGSVSSLGWSPDGGLLASGSHMGVQDNTIKIWDLENGRVLIDLVPDERAGRIQSISWSPDGLKIVSGSFIDNIAKIWDLETGAFVRNLIHDDQDPYNRLWSVAWSPDGRKIATGGEPPIKIWEAETGRLLVALPHRSHSVSWSPDSRKIASGSVTGGDGTIRIWDAESGRELISISGYREETVTVAWSPEGSLIATSGDFSGTMKVWNAQTGEEVWNVRGVGSIAWSTDGSQIAGGGDRVIRIWQARTGQLLITIETPPIYWIAWSPDGRQILSNGNDLGSIKIWDVETAREVRTITTGHNAAMRSVIWSSDGSFIASGADDGTVRIFGSRTQDFEQILR